MWTRPTLWIGIGGAIAGVLALGTEALPALGFAESTRAASFRGMVVLAAIMLLTALLLAVLRLARTVEELPARLGSMAEVFRLGISLGLHLKERPNGGKEGPGCE